MKSVFVFLSVLLLAHSISALPLSVTLRVFSSGEDPSWTIDDEVVNSLLTLVRNGHKSSPVASYRVLGYRGFVLSTPSAPRGFLVYGSPTLELLLLNSAPAGVLSDEVKAHVHELVYERLSSNGADKCLLQAQEKCKSLSCVCTADCSCQAEDMTNLAPISTEAVNGLQDGVNCDAGVVGPDTVPAYDPEHDNGGCYVTNQWANNCYNYGTDVLTNTFAQPGRGTGAKWVVNTCEDVQRAASHDGLQWIGTELPAEQPAVGHHVSLHIWPNTNFHWVRRDIDGHWSHKPGGSPVRNSDNTGGPVTDPSKGDFAPWSIFCGYFLVVPSKITIN
eukprot:GILI01019126.1.p1 GENE.GILI01019126.1~~GILI01019126.1.p1  ORF type:complete len:347 (-),score=87.00 GILI01019126.1:151-1146(-)